MDKETWINYAVDFIVDFATKDGKTFSANDLWDAGLTEPQQATWLGNAMVKAKKLGFIRKVGTAESQRTHASIISAWRAA